MQRGKMNKVQSKILELHEAKAKDQIGIYQSKAFSNYDDNTCNFLWEFEVCKIDYEKLEFRTLNITDKFDLTGNCTIAPYFSIDLMGQVIPIDFLPEEYNLEYLKKRNSIYSHRPLISSIKTYLKLYYHFSKRNMIMQKFCKNNQRKKDLFDFCFKKPSQIYNVITVVFPEVKSYYYCEQFIAERFDVNDILQFEYYEDLSDTQIIKK